MYRGGIEGCRRKVEGGAIVATVWTRWRRAAVLLASVMVWSRGAGADTTILVGVDTDGSAVGGCALDPTATGLELLLTIEVSGNPPVVAAVGAAPCIPALETFDDPSPVGGGWPVGLNIGFGAADVVEAVL